VHKQFLHSESVKVHQNKQVKLGRDTTPAHKALFPMPHFSTPAGCGVFIFAPDRR